MDTMQEHKDGKPLLDFLYEFWWVKLPRKAARLSGKLSEYLMDGHYLTIVKPLAALLPLAMFILGFLWGWKDWGVYHVFTESKTLILVIIAIGALSSNLGMFFLVGFIIGDFFLDTHIIGNVYNRSFIAKIFLVNVPLIIKYSLLWMLLVFMPNMTKSLVLQLRFPKAMNLKTIIVIGAVFNVFLTGVFIYYWAQIAAFILRPLFTWQGGSLYTQTFVYLQTETMSLVFVAMAVVAIRMWLQALTVFNPKYKKAIDAYELDLQAENTEPVQTIKMNPWLAVILYTLWAILLISGLFQTWWEALILTAFTFVIYSIQRNLISIPIDPWRRLINKVHPILRLLGVFILIYYAGKYVVLESWRRGNIEFRSMVIMAGLAIFILFLFNPGKPKETSK